MTYAAGATNAQNPNLPVSQVSEWDKTFPQSNKVAHKKVTFKNRYGITGGRFVFAEKTRWQTACDCD